MPPSQERRSALNAFVDHHQDSSRGADVGRMFVRICLSFPFNARRCINGPDWLACRWREEGIPVPPCGKAFRTGYRLAVLDVKPFPKLDAPRPAGTLEPLAGDERCHRTSERRWLGGIRRSIRR